MRAARRALLHLNLEAFAGTLKELHLQRNRIASVDGEALAHLAPSLAVLNLSRNGLREAPDLSAFRALRVLDLSGNALEAVPVSLPGASLTVLDLRGNAFGDGVPDRDRGRVLAGCPALDGNLRPVLRSRHEDVPASSPASPTPGAPRDRPSASQVAQRQEFLRSDPDRDRPAHGADGAASAPRVPDARRGARPPLGVAGPSAGTRSAARFRPRSACSRR